MIICSFRRCFVFFWEERYTTPVSFCYFSLSFARHLSELPGAMHISTHLLVVHIHQILFTRTIRFFAARQPKLSSNAGQTSRRGIIKEIDKTLKVNWMTNFDGEKTKILFFLGVISMRFGPTSDRKGGNLFEDYCSLHIYNVSANCVQFGEISPREKTQKFKLMKRITFFALQIPLRQRPK